MKLIDLLRNKQLSVYQCAKESQIPYTTLSDLVKGKTSLENCTAVTLYKIVENASCRDGRTIRRMLQGTKF